MCDRPSNTYVGPWTPVDGVGHLPGWPTPSSHPPCGHSFMCWHGVETLLSTMLGPAMVVASGWGCILVVPARHGGGMAMLGIVVVVEREEVCGLFETWDMSQMRDQQLPNGSASTQKCQNIDCELKTQSIKAFYSSLESNFWVEHSYIKFPEEY